MIDETVNLSANSKSSLRRWTDGALVEYTSRQELFFFRMLYSQSGTLPTMKIQTATIAHCCLFSICVFVISGCSDAPDRPATAPVSGTVMYNGAAVEGASVAFWTPDASRAATGVTDAEGKFTLSMFEANDGAVPGEHTITVTKVEAGAAGGDTSMEDALNDPAAMADMAAMGQGADAGPKSLVPAKYGDKASSPLKETVAPNTENSFVLQLVD